MKRLLLIESRVDEFKKNYANKFTPDQLNKLVSEFKPKYLPWVGKHLDSAGFDNNIDRMKALVDYFDRFGTNLIKKNLYDYKNVDELRATLDAYANRQRRNYKKIQGANVVFESPRFLVVNPLSWESSCFYGKGTRWCTTSSNETFKNYNTEGKLFYILDKNLPTSDRLYKIAIHKKFDGNTTFWDAPDKQMTESEFLSLNDVAALLPKIDEYFAREYSDQIKEEEKKRKEQEERRAASIRQIESIRRGKLADIQLRRESEEWEYGSDLSDEGKMAWAIMYQLDSDDEETFTTEDYARLKELNAEIEELNYRVRTEEGDTTELEEKIEELETEKEELLEEKIDVYSVIEMPRASHYGLSMFEVFHPNRERTYAVGTESEVEDAAKEYVDNLIDDIGFEGFRDSFISNYIDEDDVARVAEDFYNDFVRDSPESYLNDEDRELSNSQLAEVEKLKLKLKGYRKAIVALQDQIDQIEDEDEIEELQNQIDEYSEEVEEMESEIEEIESDPQGEFSEDKIEEVVEENVRQARRDPERFISDHGLNMSDFINRREFIQGVVDEDGYGILSPYDNSYDTFNVLGTDYYVFRID